MKMLKEYISFVLESNDSFIDIYNSYANSQSTEEEDQQPEEDIKPKDKDNLSILSDPYAYINFPRKKKNS